jgi:hypothetical protein
MGKGFQDSSEAKVQAVVRRLAPAALRQDEPAFMVGVAKMKARYGEAVMNRALEVLMQQVPWVYAQVAKYSPEIDQIIAASLDSIANRLDAAGMRVEEHLRMVDGHIALSTAAIELIAATGFPNPERFGRGNESVTGLGLKRLGGFFHPLGKVEVVNGEDVLDPLGFASVLVSSANGWIPTDDGGVTAIGTVKAIVAAGSPTADALLMLKQARYSDSVLLRLCSIIAKSFEDKAAIAFER